MTCLQSGLLVFIHPRTRSKLSYPELTYILLSTQLIIGHQPTGIFFGMELEGEQCPHQMQKKKGRVREFK